MRYTSTVEKFTPWQPSTWPEPPDFYTLEFLQTLEKIIKETILDEIDNVISDAYKVNGGLAHRGHVVVLALLCAVDSIAAYSFIGGVGERYKNFISIYFPSDYQPFATEIYNLYRNSSVHSWNLFQVAIWPGNEPITTSGGSLSFGIVNFYNALVKAVDNFLSDLPSNTTLQINSLKRYSELKHTAIS